MVYTIVYYSHSCIHLVNIQNISVHNVMKSVNCITSIKGIIYIYNYIKDSTRTVLDYIL